MFVTSDIFDLARIAQFHQEEWRENLSCVVAFHGRDWPGVEVAARFLVEAANRCELMREMQYGGYDRIGDNRTRSIAPMSVERIAGGHLSGAKGAVGVLLTGVRDVQGARKGILIGGAVSGFLRADIGAGPKPTGGHRPYQGYFIFPLGKESKTRAIDLFRLAVSTLQCDYGYYYIRDELCFPSAYASGMGISLDFSSSVIEDNLESHNWTEYGRDQLWCDAPAKLRDLFEINLLSRCHTETPIEGMGFLLDWIGEAQGRGRLLDLNSDRWLWILTDEEIVRVRPILHDAGLLLSCRPRVYRDLTCTESSVH